MRTIFSRAKKMLRAALALAGSMVTTTSLTGICLAAATTIDPISSAAARNAVQDHTIARHWHEQIAIHILPFGDGAKAEENLRAWGFTTYHYDRDALEDFETAGLIADVPSDAMGALIAGQSIGTYGFGQPHLRAIVFLRHGDIVHSVRTDMFYVG